MTTLPVTIEGDTTDEFDETLFVTLNSVSANATLSGGRNQGTDHQQ